MKTKLLLIALAFGLMSGTCSNEDDKPQQVDCNCGVITEKFVVVIPNSVSTHLTIKNNCTNEISTIDVPGNQGTIGDEWCNN